MVGDLFWLFFLLSAVQPLVRQRLLEAARQRLIARIEAMRGSRVIVLVHREETMSIFGIPVYRYIDIQDSEAVIRAIHLTDPDVPLDIILHTPGGLVLAAVQIARAIRRHRGRVTAFIPHYAMSGGTLIALAADEIVMDEHAVLGPVDPQLGQYPAASVVKVAQMKPLERVDDRTLILADVAQKALAQVRMHVEELLEGRYPPEKAREIARILSEGTWTHDHPINCQEAQALGLHVRCGVPTEIYQLMALYPQPVRRAPSVEYLPGPRHRGEEGR